MDSPFNTHFLNQWEKISVPSYQRAFSWKKEQVGLFISDLKDIKWVFDDFARLNSEMSFVNVKLSYIQEPISVISSFSSRGIKEPRLYKVIYSALAGFLFAFSFLLIKSLIVYLNKVEGDYL